MEKIEIDPEGHGLTKTETRRVVDGDDSFDCAIVLLAGGAYERALGLKVPGDAGDLVKAVVLMQETFETAAAARRGLGFDVVLEARMPSSSLIGFRHSVST